MTATLTFTDKSTLKFNVNSRAEATDIALKSFPGQVTNIKVR
jgi:uncharacterized membrane protein YkoI